MTPVEAALCGAVFALVLGCINLLNRVLDLEERIAVLEQLRRDELLRPDVDFEVVRHRDRRFTVVRGETPRPHPPGSVDR